MADTKVAAKAPPGAVYDMAASFQSDLDAGVTAANDQMLAAWAQTYAQTRSDYDGLLAKIAQAQADGKPLSPAWLHQKDRLKNVLAQTKGSIHQFAQEASAATVQAHKAAVQASAYAHAKMGAQAMQESVLAGGFNRINPDNLKHLVGFTADGTPVAALFASLATESADGARDALVRGLSMGKPLPWITRRLEQALDIPRWRSETIVRTEAQRVYRSVARQTYLQNADVLEGWVWMAHLDSRTCPACMAMDGKIMPVGSTLDGHPRCRCAMVPRTKSWADLGLDESVGDTRPPVRDGQAWFKGQPASVQRAILGPRKFKAWQDGQITLDDLVARHSHPTWGTMRRERSMQEIVAGKGANWDDAVEVLTPPRPVPLSADPAKVIAIKDTHTVHEVEAALETGDLTEQARLDYLAAHRALVGEMPKGPRFRPPPPDPVWVNTAAEKMNKAVLSKGYPSKGYSQTQAIYKAKANGKPGTKVGVVKSLSWEEKLGAQQALEQHNAWLAQHLAVKASSKAEGKAVVKALEQDMDDAMTHAQTKAELDIAETKAGFIHDPMEAERTKGYVQAKAQQYADSQQVAQTYKSLSDEWTGPHADVRLSPDGWGMLQPHDGSDWTILKPNQVNDLLGDDAWAPKVAGPDPAKVAQYVHDLKDADGYLDAKALKDYEDALAAPDPVAVIGSPQAVADIAETVNVAKATLPWKPEPSYVAKIKAGLNDGTMNAADLKAIADNPAAMPLTKANITEALAQHAADLKATADVAKAAKAAATKAAKEAKAKAAEAKGAVGWGAPPDVATLKAGETLGTKGARVYTDPQGNRWLFKPPVTSADTFMPTLDEATSRIQAMTGLKAPDTYVVEIGGTRGSLQRMFPGSKDAFPGGALPDHLNEPDMLALQKEQVLDWLLSNHHGHPLQYVRHADGTLSGIDKGQAFRWADQDRLDWDYHPNALTGAPEPVMNTVWKRYASGHADEVFSPKMGPLADYIETVQEISDADLKRLLRPYAEQAAAAGRLAGGDVEKFLTGVVARKNGLAKDFSDLYDKGLAARQKALPKPVPAKAKAGKPTTGKARWKDRPAPEKPAPPTPPAEAVAATFDPWVAKVKARFKAFADSTGNAKNDLTKSLNWPTVEKVIKERDKQALTELKSMHYIDDVLEREALDLIDKAEAQVKSAEAAHAKAMAAYEKELGRWKADTADWREANGIVDLTLGMDDDVLRHTTDAAGNKWALKAMADPGWTATERKYLRTYTGNTHHAWNSQLRSSKGQPGQYATPIKSMDAAMTKSAIPEDVILHRGTGVDSFVLNGRLLDNHEAHRLVDLVGSVQQDHAYTSSSVGNSAAFAHQPVQIKFRAPAGTPGAYVDSFSQFGGEREVILARGTSYFVHAVYKSPQGKWIMEAEIVPADFDPLKATPKPASKPWTH